MKTQFVKMVVNTVISGTAAMVVKEALVNNLPVATNTIKKVGVGIGVFTIGMLVTDVVSDKVDGVFESIEDMMETIKEEA